MAKRYNSKAVYELLCRIDEGYTPGAEESRMLSARRILNLSGYEISFLPRSLGQLVSLQELDLSNTPITALSESLGQLANLQKLYLSGTKIIALPESFGQLANLQSLSLRGTPITALPESLGQFANLQKLYLSGTQITTLPESFKQLANLQNLSLRGTPITALPESLGQLAGLRWLSLNGTPITALPESFGQLAKLRWLNLSSTKITALPDSFWQLAGLRWLDLSSTKISALPESFGQLANLEILDLDSAPISALPASFGELAALRELYLSKTRITELPACVAKLPRLRALWLGRSGVTRLPAWIGELPALENLSLSGLTLPSLPRSLALRGLRFVDGGFSSEESGVNLRSVTLTEQDLSVFLQNDPELIRGLYEEAALQPLRECRVIFLGDGASGKSYTIRRFRRGGRRETAEEPFDVSETPGVEILDETVSWEGQDYTLHFWDFGGQQLLHSMHRCFLSEDSCYVVTVKSRETKADERVRYWLRNVTAFAPKSPILLFINCWDNDNGLRVLDESRLKKDFPMIRRVVCVSAKAAEDRVFREALIEPLVEIVASSEGCRRKENRRWKAVRDAIAAESRGRNYLSRERYHALCAANGVEDDGAPALLAYFNSLGVCFSYHRDENRRELADYRLLNPVWLTNAIYAIIEEGMPRAVEGRIRAEQIVALLCGEAPKRIRERDYRRTVPEIVYRPEECAYILDVAVLHKLCYRLDGETLFFPALCPTKSPPEALEEPGEGLRCVQYRLKYSYLPDNVIHRLMIRCMRNDYSVDHCWLRGLLLAHSEGPRVQVRMDDDETLRIDLWADPVRPASVIFLRLRDELLRINGELGLTASEVIVDGEDQYSVVSLLRASERGSKVYGNVSGEERDAADLLGDFYESRIIKGIRVENKAIVVQILPTVYHRFSKDNQALRKALFEAYNGVCPYCNNPIRNYREMEVDHIFPSKYRERPELGEYVKYLNDKGFDTAKPDYLENYFPAHHSCNLDKSNCTDPFSLMAWHLHAARMAAKVLRLLEAYQADGG